MSSRLQTLFVPAALLALSGCASLASGFGSLNSINPQEVAVTVTGGTKSTTPGVSTAPDPSCIALDQTGAAQALASPAAVASAVDARQLEGVKAEVQKKNAVSSVANFYLASKIAADSPAARKPQPASIGISEFRDLENFLKGIKGAGERVEFYELQYFKGNFINRFGDSIKPSEITEKNQDQELQNLLTVFLEALIDAADEYYFWKGKNETPVPYWGSGDPDKSSVDYYLSGKSIGKILPQEALPPTDSDNFTTLQDLALVTPKPKYVVPTFIAYAYYQYYSKQFPTGQLDKPAQTTWKLRVKRWPINASAGCGMTQIKIDTLLYLSRRAGVLTGAEAGAVLGAIGGINLGLPVVLGKVSIGDNQTVRTIVQAFLAEAAERATLGSGESVLLKANLGSGSLLDAVLNSLVVQPSSASQTSSQNTSGS